MDFCSYKTLFDLASESSRTTLPPIEFYDSVIDKAQYQLMQTGDMNQVGNIRNWKNEQNFFRLRKPSYKVYPGIAVALTTTNIEIPAEEVNLPFDVFEVQLPPNTIYLDPESVQPTNPLKGQVCACGIFVAENPATLQGRQTLPGTKVLTVTVDARDTGDPHNLIDCRSFILLQPDKTVVDGVDKLKGIAENPPTRADQHRLAALVTGVIFMAVSRNRQWISKVRIKARNQDWCLCGSGKKFKKCCGAKSVTTTGEPVGFAIGKGIDLPYRSSSSKSIIEEGSGRELQYGHIRSGHMRWQWKKDDQGNPTRELIFIHPTIVRPDLPLKPHATPHQIRPKEPPKRNPDDQQRDLIKRYLADPKDAELRGRLLALLRRTLQIDESLEGIYAQEKSDTDFNILKKELLVRPSGVRRFFIRFEEKQAFPSGNYSGWFDRRLVIEDTYPAYRETQFNICFLYPSLSLHLQRNLKPRFHITVTTTDSSLHRVSHEDRMAALIEMTAILIKTLGENEYLELQTCIQCQGILTEDLDFDETPLAGWEEQCYTCRTGEVLNEGLD